MLKKYILKSLFFVLLINISAETLADTVSLKEKIGQMLLIGFKGLEIKPSDSITQAILTQQIGGVVLFDYDLPTKTYDRNIKDPKQLKLLTQQLQAYAKQAAMQHKNNFFPLFVAIDYEGGKVSRLKEEYGFPKTLSAAEIGKGSYEQAEQYAQEMSDVLQQEGININLAPVIDVDVNPNNPIIGKLERSFSSDPHKVSKYAAIFSKAYQPQGVLCTYKHFPGHGSSTGDTHQGFVDVTNTWKEYELDPYISLLNKPFSCSLVMTAHVVNRKLDAQGYPATLSSAMTTNLLRGKLKFKGVVITDDLQMKAISEHYKLADVVRLAINAGADILVFANQINPTAASEFPSPQQIIDLIDLQVKEGKIPKSRIDESYQRIMWLKKQIGIL